MKDDRLYLIHIWECIQRIESYAEDGKEAFLASTMMQVFMSVQPMRSIEPVPSLAISTQWSTPS